MGGCSWASASPGHLRQIRVSTAGMQLQGIVPRHTGTEAWAQTLLPEAASPAASGEPPLELWEG